MAEHTPGPWHASRLCRYINTLQNRPIAEMIDRPNRVADAHLFAAAPDLLAVALGYEAWEADLIMNNGWNGKDGLPTLTGPQYDEMMRLQGLRNAAIAKALCGSHSSQQRAGEKS